MGTRRKVSEPPQVLSGWKDVARHLGMGVRTVQRYERLMGLPVRRPAGRSRGSVVATISELDAWVTASPIREAFHLTKSPPDFRVRNLETVRVRLGEMRALREQMWELRNELKTSLTLLTESIRSLQSGLAQHPRGSIDSLMADNPVLSEVWEQGSSAKRRKVN